MKFDKAQIFVLVVGIAILLGWDPVCKYMGWFQVPVNAPAQAPAAPAAAAPSSGAAVQAPSSPTAPVAKKSSQPTAAPKIRSVGPMAPIEVANPQLKLIIDPVAGSVLDFVIPELKEAPAKP